LQTYKLKLVNEEENAKMGCYIRYIYFNYPACLTKALNLKISKLPIERFGLNVPLNEIYLRIDEETINRINNENSKREYFISKILQPKIKKGKINISISEVIINKASEEIIKNIVEFLFDLIFSRSDIHIITPPKIVTKSEQQNFAAFINGLDYLHTLLTSYYRESEIKIGYFIPSYTTRTQFSYLISRYANYFGSDGLYMIDVDGGRFSSLGYSITSQIMRIMSVDYGEENYGLYLYNHKERKKSGNEVPSEDFLAILNGVNFIGPLHKNNPLPVNVVEEMKRREQETKVFNTEDLLYYPLKRAPNNRYVESWLDENSLPRNYRSLNLFNDSHSISILLNLIDTDAVYSVLSRLTRQFFLEELKKLHPKVTKELKAKSLKPFSKT
jgi:hypothetical protein